MKKSIIIFVFALLVFAGCNKNNQTERKNVDGTMLEGLVINAIKGNSAENASLNNLIDVRLPININYNDLIIDSLNDNSGRKFYSVLIEYPNPAYNRFAVYDSLLNNYLIDKSLNGRISFQNISQAGLTLIKLNENFLSKDIFNLNRSSLYLVNDTSVSLVFRTFTSLKYNQNEFTQHIDEISAKEIKSTLGSNIDPLINNLSDEFIFDDNSGKYESEKDLFDKFVINKLIDFKDSLINPEITDEKSLWKSVGINSSDNAKNNNPGNPGFTISLSEDWQEFQNFGISQFLNKQMKGTKYYNATIGATISVVEIPVTNDAEDFINYRLDKISKGRIRIRYSDEITTGKDFVKFYEFYCDKRKFLFIMQGSRFTYNNYKDLYSKIIDSFSMDCNV